MYVLRKLLKGCTVVLLILVLLISVLGILLLAEVSPDIYSEEKHLERIAKRVQDRYIDGDARLNFHWDEDEVVAGVDENFQSSIKATGFKLYPMYDWNDNLSHVLVEFEPYGYTYLLVNVGGIIPSFSVRGGMYTFPSRGADVWSPCHFNKYGDVVFETDDFGNNIVYVRSPFTVRGVTDEKMYMINYDRYDDDISGYFPAVKRNGKFVNLYSLDEFEVVNGQVTSKQAISDTAHYMPFYPQFDL